MVLLVIFSYFMLIAGAVVLFAFPGIRMRVFGALSSTLATTSRGLASTFTSGSVTATKSGNALRTSFTQGIGFLRSNPRLTAAALLLVIIPPSLALMARGPAVFSFDNDNYRPDRQISVLLEGEQLVPPPALPPEVFTTREVVLARPNIVFANRNWAQLDPDFTQRLLRVMKIMKERYGYEMVLLEGFRSAERQAKLAALGSSVTQAGAYMSYHQYGLAADCAFMQDNKIVISELDPWAMHGYELYGQVAESVGLRWGGTWKMRDLGHVELARKGVLGTPPAI